MTHRLLEEWFDTLMYLALITGMLILFCCYWKTEYRVRLSEVVVQEFLQEVSAEGKITLATYEQMRRNLERFVPGYEVEMMSTDYVLQPVYAMLEKEQLERYYQERNIRKEIILQQEETVVVEEDAEHLCMQKETNASILAADVGRYLPLPEEENIVIEAVRQYQEVYEGEALITVCRITSDIGTYYAETPVMYADVSGKYYFSISVDGISYDVPVVVDCYPRIVTCTNGHKVVNSESVREEWKKSGMVRCPHCHEIPIRITCNTTVLQTMTGEKLSKDEIYIIVEFMDGHFEVICPGEAGWQDNYDSNYCGTQKVTIRYYGAESEVVVTSMNGNCAICGEMCGNRNYSDYTNFPYCTGCMSEVPLFNGEVFCDEQKKDNTALLKLLDEKGEVCFTYGTLIVVKVSKDGKCALLLQNEVKQDGIYR